METLWEKLTQFFYKKKKMPLEGVDYKFIDFTDSELTGIQIIKGEYAGVVYHYGKVRVKEQGEMGVLEFGYTIVNPGKHDIDALQNDEGFVTIMGDTLTEILTRQANETIRKDDSEEFNLQ
jgi:hypothetical protein